MSKKQSNKERIKEITAGIEKAAFHAMMARDLSRIFFSEIENLKNAYKEIRGSRLIKHNDPTVRRPTSWRNDCGILQVQLTSTHRECFAILSP